jgi:REP element-mobilizing transposase RayT
MPSKPLLNRFEPGKYYHVFNRGNNKETAFYDEHCYYYFLDKYQELLSESVDTLAYVLMPNHFHFLFKVKESNIVKNGKVISNQFRKLSLTYTIHTNKNLGRIGSIFTRGLRKKTVEDSKYLKYLIFYIHFNPQKHGLVKNFSSYNFSSYYPIQNTEGPIISHNLILSFFGSDVNEFKEFHRELHNENRIVKYLME